MLIVESEHDDIIPPPVIANYMAAFEKAHSLTYRVIEGADHGLSAESWQQAYTTLLVNWVTEMVLGARQGEATPKSQAIGDRVFFESDSTDLTPTAIATLDKQAQWLSRYPRYTFLVEGHADERGTREYNFSLGARRAQTVRQYLASRGVAAPCPTARSVPWRCATTSRAGRKTAAP